MVAFSRNSNNSSSRCISTTISNSICRQLQFHLRTQKTEEQESDHIWLKIQAEASSNSHQEPALSNYYKSLILNHDSLDSALAHQLAVKLSLPEVLPVEVLYPVFTAAFKDDIEIRAAVRADLLAARERDPACQSYLECFLNYKGFLALQSHRVAHWCWKQKKTHLALTIQGRTSAALGVDIHPGASIGKGILIDHGTGVVIGETAVVGDGVTMLHGVTLGGRGKNETGKDRHPKVGDGVFVGAGASILGNIAVGRAVKIGAAAVVVKDVPAEATAVGNPARLIRGKGS
ncbi:hypothetical protein V2J09_012296 [Rumex salicifolius]